MHFWLSATRGGFHDGFCRPRKIGTNWFMPALVKRRFGESGKSDDDGTMVCFFSRKKSRNDCRISADVIMNTVSLLDQSCLQSHRQPMSILPHVHPREAVISTVVLAVFYSFLH